MLLVLDGNRSKQSGWTMYMCSINDLNHDAYDLASVILEVKISEITGRFEATVVRDRYNTQEEGNQIKTSPV